MESINIENQSSQSEETPEDLLTETVTDTLENVKCDNRSLKRALKYLSGLENKKKRKSSPTKDCFGDDDDDDGISDADLELLIRCRQLSDVVERLGSAVMRQDWDEAIVFVLILCDSGLIEHCTLITRVCFLVLLSHPNSSFSLLQQFIRLASEYILEEDINKFIRILFVLGKDVGPAECGNYIKNTGDYKVVRDIDFEKL